MKRKWKVAIDGENHEISFKQGIIKGRKIVDGKSTPVKSSSWIIQLFDEPIEIGDKTLHLTAIGSKVDLAVDGVYLNSKKPYVPLSKIPSWAHGFSIALFILGWFLAGIFGILVGLFGGMLIITNSVSTKIKKPLPICIVIFVICLIFQLAFFALGVAATL